VTVALRTGFQGLRPGFATAGGGAAFPTPNTKSLLFSTDFAENTTPSFLTLGTAGTGAGVFTGDVAQPGIANLRASAVADRASLATNIASLTYDPTSRLYTRFRVQVPTLSTLAVEQFIFRIGFGDNNAGDQVDGAYIEWDTGVNANVQCKTASNSVRTQVDAGAPGAWTAGSWHDVDILGNSASIAFAFDGITVATITTNIPNSSARVFGAMAHIIKVAGATQRAVLMDYWLAEAIFDTARGVGLAA
jgi:SO2946-like, C-terminal domain